MTSDVACDTEDLYCSVDKSSSLYDMANIDIVEECIEEECEDDNVNCNNCHKKVLFEYHYIYSQYISSLKWGLRIVFYLCIWFQKKLH